MTKLTKRQIEILKLLEKGLDVTEVAEKLNLARKTIEAHLYGGAYKALQVTNREEALKEFKKLKLDN